MPMARFACSLPTLCAVLCFSGCDPLTGTLGRAWEQAELEANRAKWASAGPASYRFTLDHEFFYELYRPPTKISVENKVIVSATVWDEAVSPETLATLRTIDGWFDYVQQELNRAADSATTS